MDNDSVELKRKSISRSPNQNKKIVKVEATVGATVGAKAEAKAKKK